MSLGQKTYRLKLGLGRKVLLDGRESARESFYDWLYTWLDRNCFLGLHEGTLLSEAAAEQGLETESWTVDSAEAPRERDWVGGQSQVEAELYFATEEAARAAAVRIQAATDALVRGIEVQLPRDWDAEWKASFLANSGGLRVPPHWHIVPYWVKDEDAALRPGERVIRINPGAGFGTGTHETTQLCLEAIATAPRAARALDFGSGSGILSIALALLGAEVDSVEIDPLAVDNARENARLNAVESKIRFESHLEAAPGPYRLVVANILKPVLLEFADQLVARLEPEKGTLILSGLIERDVDEVRAQYEKRLGRSGVALQRGEWRCLVWASPQASDS